MITEVRNTMNAVRGGLFTVLETLGLQESQERAAKGLVRKLTYDAQATLEATVRARKD
jgi:hypothetical protein